MKRTPFVLAALLAVSFARAESLPRLVKAQDQIGPSTASITVHTSTGTFVAIAAPTVGLRNCITRLEVSTRKNSPATSYTINILDAGTTTYSVTASTGTNILATWPETYPWCGGTKKATYVTGTSLYTGGVVLDVNYQGFTQ